MCRNNQERISKAIMKLEKEKSKYEYTHPNADIEDTEKIVEFLKRKCMESVKFAEKIERKTLLDCMSTLAGAKIILNTYAGREVPVEILIRVAEDFYMLEEITK